MSKNLNLLRKQIEFFVLVFCFFSAQQVFATNADDILGIWLTPESTNGNARIQVFKKHDKYVGKIIWLEKPLYTKDNSDGGEEGTPLLDKGNPNTNMQSRPLLGLHILQGFTFRKNRWQGGTIYDPESGKNYKCKITLRANGTLKVRGFIGVAMLGRTSIWAKFSESK